MKLLSATARNYRIHRDLNIDFDQARTLIGGANETGKTTLIEAIHRGLFLKSTITGEGQKSMVSTLFPGHPEVEIRFSANGAEYHLAKRFSGASGTTQLVQVGGQTWRGEEAESRLARLLGVEELGGGRGILSRISEQWSHLWVWQGRSGDDPSEPAASQQAHLLQQLQQTGGAVAMQSELDGRVASRFARVRAQIFVRAGSARSGSDLDKAQTEAQQVETNRAEASERLDRLRQAVRDFEDASSTIQRTTSDLEDLRQERQGVNEKISQAEELRQAKETQASTVNSAVENLTVVEGIEKNIDGLRESISTLQKSLKPKQEEERRLESAFTNSRKRTTDAEREYDEALKKTREVRLRRELAAAYVNRFEKEARNKELRKRLERAQALEKDIAGFREQLAQLVSIDQEGLQALQELENELAQASAALNAMAAEIEIVVSDQPVRVGDAELSAGESQTVTEPTEVKVGDLLCLRIHPGGGDSLANAREELRTLRENRRRSLDEYGLKSIAKASEVVARRADLQSRVANAEAALEELDAEDLAKTCSSAKDELTAAEADVKRRMDQVADAEQPSTLADARAWRDREEDAFHTVESDETSLKATQDTLQQEQGDLENESNTLRDTIAGEKQDLTGFEAQLKLLLDTHGDDEPRAKALKEARKAKKDSEASLAEICAALEALQPDLLKADRERLQRAWDETERQKQGAQTSRAVSQAALRSDGAIDPNAALAQAEAKLEAATEHLEAVSRKAKAIALIDSLFQQEQRALADQFSQPLAQKISSYLQCLFGPDAKAVVTFEDNAFKSIQLVRSAQDGAMLFKSLSGGTREQVAAAVRLAIAELLAADHDNSLPIVFDDAFAYSDPERVNTLQRMLDLGASRGLQIIVLTCNTSDYAALGARQIILKSKLLRNAPPTDTSLPAVSGNASGLETVHAGSSANSTSIMDQVCESFIAALTDLGGKSGNQTLRKNLGWDEVKYTAVKDQLIAQNQIVRGKGRGGSVALKH
jgi:DNA repair exonuclease SbcCD ATPase subunit